MGTYCYQIATFNGIYFYIVCKYFNIKIENFNESLKEMKKSHRILIKKVHTILRSMNDLYCEIDDELQ